MTKKLPRTSSQTLDDLRPTATNAPGRLPSAALRAAPVRNRRSPGPGVTAIAPAAHASPARSAKAPDRAQQPAPAPSQQPTREAFRRAAGQLIIERHANLAAFAGLIPVPLVDVAAIAAVVDRMLRKLARLHGRRLGPERSRRLATAMLAGVAAPSIGRLTTTTLLGFMPGTQLLGIAAGSISATVLVRVIGEAYLDRLSAGPGERLAAQEAARN